MSDLQWTPPRGSTPQPIGCDRNELILALTKASQPWEKLDIIDATLKKCGLDPFFDVLDIPNSGILGEDIPESARRGHENSLIRALVIQAFGKIPNLVKKSDIAALKNDVSRNLLTVLKEEASHGETTLIRWSATIAIRSIWYDEEWEKQGKYYSVNAGINAPRLEQKIIEDQVNRLISNRPIQRYNYTGRFSTEYQDYLDFWGYGPIWVLFNLPYNSEEYKFLVEEILEQLQARGVNYGLSASNNFVIERSLEIANKIFDRSNFFQIITKLSKFLQHGESKFRDKAVEMLKPYKKQLDKKSLCILEALSFIFYLENLNLEFLSIVEIEKIIESTNNYKKEIEKIFSDALSSCDVKAYEVKKFLENKLQHYNNNINEYNKQLLKQWDDFTALEKLIRKKIDILFSTLNNIKKIDQEIFYKFSSQNQKIITSAEFEAQFDNSTYETCQKINKELNSIKKSFQSILGQLTSDLSPKNRELTEILWENFSFSIQLFIAGVFIQFFVGVILAIIIILGFPFNYTYATKAMNFLAHFWFYLCIIIGGFKTSRALISWRRDMILWSETKEKYKVLIEIQNKLYSQWKEGI